MEPVTHLLTGLTLARVGAHRLASSATVAVTLGAVLPDIDLVYPYGAAQGWTHSLTGLAGLAVALTLPFWLRARRRRELQSQLFFRLLAACSLGLASHLLLDWTTAAGVRFFWPLAGAWYALDWFSAVDLLVLAVLLAGLLVPTLFRLIAEEIGARASARGARRGAWTGIILLLLLCALRGSLHTEALARLEGQSYRGRTPVRVAAFPTPVNPFLWRGVAETTSTYELVEVRLAGMARGTSMSFTHYKPSPSAVLAAAAASPAGRTFLEFARFPLAHVELIPNGHRVMLRDLRFAQASIGRPAVRAWIELDRKFQIVDAGLTFGEQD